MSSEPPTGEQLATVESPGKKNRRRLSMAAMGSTLTNSLGVAFLVLQAALIVYLKFEEESRVRLTPLEGHTVYRLNVFDGRRDLTADEIQRRYRIPIFDTTNLTPEGLRTLIRHYEKSYAGPDRVFVRLHTSQNGDPEEIWLWPEL